jgi:hypothetical protein
MTAAAFDTLKLVRRLTAGGMADDHATVIAEALAETLVIDPATRSDLARLDVSLRDQMRSMRDELRGEMSALRDELRGEISALREELRGEIGDLRKDLHAEKQEVRLELAKLRGDMVAGFATTKVEILRWIVPLILAQMALTLGAMMRLAG